MGKKAELQRYIVKDTIIRGINKFVPGYLEKSLFYGKREILDGETCQDFIVQKILSGEPFMAGRYGSVELRCMVEYEKIENGLLTDYCEKTYTSMPNNAGFFPANEKNFERFAKMMRKSSQQADLIGVWFNKLENYYIDEYAPQTQLTLLMALEPYFYANPWSCALKGKRVLVIHPFVESIKKQYSIREKLFSNPDVLPEFELLCYKAAQTVGGEDLSKYASWFDVLEMMHEDIKKIDFDIAILGCGAYGFPLAAMIKEDGKQAIHMGGATQLLFGIKGKRWDEYPPVSRLYNEYWTRPLQKEQTTNYKKIEQGCYW